MTLTKDLEIMDSDISTTALIPAEGFINVDGHVIPRISPDTEIVEIDEDDWVVYYGEQIVRLGYKKSLADYWCHPEPGYNVGRCKMIKTDGDRCSNAVRHGWTVCHYHGAGRPSRPGGLTLTRVSSGRWLQAVPERLMERYEQFLSDPDVLTLNSEMALIDTRVAELLARLDTADTKMAWTKVKMALKRLDKYEIDENDLEYAITHLSEAVTAKSADQEVWKEITQLIENRRRLAETERRRIIDAQQTMTIEEANIFLAYVMTSLRTHVKDPFILTAIADDLKRVR